MSSAPVRAGRSGTVGRRVARILALPAVVVLVLLGLLAAEQVQAYRASQDTSHSVVVALGVQDLVTQLQTERGITSGVLGGNDSFRNELAPARKRVDTERADLARLVAGGSAADRRVTGALGGLSSLPQVRSATDGGRQQRAAAFDWYTDRIAELSGVDVDLDNADDTDLRRGVGSLQALQDLTEATAQERAFLNGVFSAGGFAKGEFVQFANMRAERLSAQERFRRLATPDELASMDYVYGTGAAQVTTAFEQIAIDAADGRHVVVNPQSWWSGLTTVLDDLDQLQQHVGSTIQLRAHDLQQSSAERIGGLVGIVLLCLIGSIYVAALASRSITRPLAELAAEADSVAAERLPAAVRRVQEESQGMPVDPPEPVRVPPRATEEIRSVAGALDRLQAAAYGLATEQALQRRDTIESMANLGRRNQNLIRRQLGFISSLEREEIDPSSLANLFELDHLATRMRRNAASLLVLVGASAPRQWSGNVSVADTVRAAVSEVEEYRRVSIRRVDDVLLNGAVIGSISHLLSELIENGLTFSPPDTDVEVQGRKLADGYLVAIIDQGVGMNPEDMREANARLRGEGDFIAAPTRFLGHFVVGKLARQTGVRVELLPSPVTGVTARVMLPLSLLETPLAAVPPVVTTAPAPVAVTAAAPPPVTEAALVGGPTTAEFSTTPAAVAWPEAGETDPPGDPEHRDIPAAVATGWPLSSVEDWEEPDRPVDNPWTTGDDDTLVPESPVRPQWAARTYAADPDRTPGNGVPLPPRGSDDTGSLFRPFAPPTPAEGTRPVVVSSHTRNGLPKRVPKTPRPENGNGSRRVIDLDAAAARDSAHEKARVDDSPAEVGSRLTALRSGFERGRAATPPEENG